MFAEEIKELVDEVSRSKFRVDSKRVCLQMLASLNVLDIAEDASPRRPTDAHLTVGLALEHLRKALRGDEGQLLDWVLNTVEEFINVTPTAAEHDPDLERAVEIATEAARHAAMLRDLYSVREDTQAALTEAQAAAGKAQKAAGIAGSASLSYHFRDYAKSERRAAEVFRALSIAAIVGVVIAAIYVEHPAVGDWVGLAYRVAVLAGIGALSAYFAKQAGHHRRAYNWAKGLEVQLKSFPALIDPADSEVKADIYRDFARRVLGAPPEASKVGSEDSLPTAQLIEALIALAKRSS